MFPLVTLTSDFGLRDAYVAAMKGAMLRVEPSLRLVDVSHDVPAQDVTAAAFVLAQVVPHFPDGTIHLAVVDPGVGTARRAVAARFRIGNERHLFVGPDNGLLPLLLDGLGSRDGADDEGAGVEAAVVLDRPAFWRTPSPSRTFHGRDVFAPVAAHLAAGQVLEDVGAPAGPLHPLHWALPLADDEGVRGWVVHIDRFGNCVTNIPRGLVECDGRSRRATLYVGSAILRGVHGAYGDVAPGEPLALVGSADFLEVGVNGGDAAALLTIHKGTPVNIVFADTA